MDIKNNGDRTAMYGVFSEAACYQSSENSRGNDTGDRLDAGRSYTSVIALNLNEIQGLKTGEDTLQIPANKILI